MSNAIHTFHIPVMGLAYTIDTPVKVARFGISSVISIVEDNLIEKMRAHYYKVRNEFYHPIPTNETDYRAKRITDYLNLVNRIVAEQLVTIQKEPFTEGNEIVKYFEMLPKEHRLYRIYQTMVHCDDSGKKKRLGDWLRNCLVAGAIDVNIMTKLDKNNHDKEGNSIADGSDAVAALRGYAQSSLTNSAIILSAGLNPRLFNYMEKLSSFDRNDDGTFDKRITIKVSDFRSAYVQGKMLAKKGLWVSEFRIESGLNCGGHAFATDGILIGPILEEFKNKRQSLRNEMFELYDQALLEKGKSRQCVAPSLSISVQGGIGTAEEDEFLRQHYGVNSTGWGTPFLLVPEATTVDEATLDLLSKASEKDIYMSKNSPLGVRFHYLKGTSGEREKLDRIRKGKPGSPCTEKYLVSNTEFTSDPICTASRSYQKKKLAQLQSLNLTEIEYQKQKRDVLDKECLCIGLSNSAVKKYDLKPFKKMPAVNICPGPNIAYFSKVVSLREMIDHIYGRTNILTDHSRPAMFVKELSLYVDYLREMMNDAIDSFDEKAQKQLQKFSKNISEGISYYRGLLVKMDTGKSELMQRMKEGLQEIENRFLFECDLGKSLGRSEN